MPRRMKLAIIGDPHLALPRGGGAPSSDPYLDLDLGRKLHHDSPRLLAATLDAVNAEPDVDAALLLGDMTRDGELFNHEAAAGLLSRLRMPYYLLAGNHDYLRRRAPHVTYPDCERLDRDTFIEFYRGRGLPEPRAHYAVELPGGVELLVLDSNRTLAELEAQGVGIAVQDHGYVAPEQLSWLEGRLDEAQRHGRVPLLAVHHALLAQSPVEQPGHPLAATFGFWRVTNDADVLALARRYRVPLVLSGHLHAQSVNVEHGVANLISSATVSYPHTWRVLTISDNMLHVETRSLSTALGAEFMAASQRGTDTGWGELIELQARSQPMLAPFAGAVRRMVVDSSWWSRFADGTLPGFRVPPELLATRNPLERGVLAQVAALLESYGPWKAARPDANELELPL